MSDEWEEREAKRQAQVDRQLDIYDADVKAKVRAVDQVETDMATYPERMRAARHHDVLCLVLSAAANAALALPCIDTKNPYEPAPEPADGPQSRLERRLYPPLMVVDPEHDGE